MSISHLRQFLKSALWVSQLETESHHGGSAKFAVTQVQLAQVPAAKHRANILPLMHPEISNPHPSWGKQERTLMRVDETQPTPSMWSIGGRKTPSPGTHWGPEYESVQPKKQRHHFAHKGPSSQGYGFSSGHVWMWELDCEEGWAPKNWCFSTVVLEKTLESPLDCKEI